MRRKLAEGVRIHDYYEGITLSNYGHKCVVCSAIHPCTVSYLTIPNLDFDTVDGHYLTCSLTGNNYQIGKGERDEDRRLVLTNMSGTTLEEYPIFAADVRGWKKGRRP